MLLTKSDYIHLFLHCPLHLWVAKHRPDDFPRHADPSLEWRLEQGNQVETNARRIFSAGQLVGGHDRATADATRELIGEGATTLFQATATAHRLFALADVFQFDATTKRWNIFEVKSSTEAKEIHVDDLCFQRRAFEEAGFQIGTLSLILVNNEFVRRGGIDPNRFVRIENVTSAANAVQSDVDARIDEALSVIDHKEVPSRGTFGCTCSPKDCDCCSVCFPDLPRHPVFFLPRFNNTRAQELYDQGIQCVTDLPGDAQLTETQELIVNVIKANSPFVDREGIRERLSLLRYPLYFLDYESFAPAVPIVDGYRPYQRMVFQYSLHVVHSPQGEAEHYAFLGDSLDDPAPYLTAQLRRDIGEEGTVVVWNKSFEISRNEEMAVACPQHADFLTALNGRVFDLMAVFRDQLYVHPEVGGSCSIKNVLPVLVPNMKYTDLEISDGTGASLAWYRMMTDGRGNAEGAKTRSDLLAYCKLDTRAMVEIMRRLRQL